MKRSALVAFLLLLVLVPACSPAARNAAPPPRAPTPPGDSTSTATADEAKPVPEILDFRFASLDGKTVDGGDFAGKDVAVWFWAPW